MCDERADAAATFAAATFAAATDAASQTRQQQHAADWEGKERQQLPSDKDNALLFCSHWRSVWVYCMMLDHPRTCGPE